MERVRKMLGLQTKTAVLGIVNAAVATLSSIEPIAGVDLHTRLGRPYL